MGHINTYKPDSPLKKSGLLEPATLSEEVE